MRLKIFKLKIGLHGIPRALKTASLVEISNTLAWKKKRSGTRLIIIWSCRDYTSYMYSNYGEINTLKHTCVWNLAIWAMCQRHYHQYSCCRQIHCGYTSSKLKTIANNLFSHAMVGKKNIDHIQIWACHDMLLIMGFNMVSVCRRSGTLFQDASPTKILTGRKKLTPN